MNYRRFRLAGLSLLLIALLVAALAGCGSTGTGGGGGGKQKSWTRVALDDGLLNSQGYNVRITGVVAGGPGLVAVGYEYPETGTDTALVVWTSADARTWNRQNIPTPGEDFGYYTYGEAEPSIAANAGGMVITWNTDIWTSTDGLAWTKLPPDPVNFNQTFYDYYSFRVWNISGVAPFGSGFIAAGSGLWGKRYATGGSDPCIWTSPGLTGWTLMPYQSGVLDSEHPMSMNTIAAAPPGIVAGGDVFNASGETDPNQLNHDAQFWTSPDGVSWTQVPWDGNIFGGPGDQQVMAISAGGPGVVAVGYGALLVGIYSDYTGLIWTSPDGATWKRVDVSANALDGARLTSIARWGPGLVAGGAVTQQDEDSTDKFMTGAVWESMDGNAWSQTILPRLNEENLDDLTVRGLVGFRGGLVAVGEMNPYGGPNKTGAIWVSPELSQ